MDTIALFFLEDVEEVSPSIIRKQIRDKSNPLDIPDNE